MSIKKIISTFLLALLAILVGPIFTYAGHGQYDQAVIVEPHIVDSFDFYEQFKGVGQVKYAESQYITAKKGGTIEFVTAMQGHPVKKGDVIISLSESKARQALAKAEAELESAESTLKRDQSLQAKKIISEDVLDKSKVALERSKLEVITAQEDLEDLIITAPFDGVIGVIKPRVGEEINVGDKLFTIITPSKKEVIVELPQTMCGKFDDKTKIFATDLDNKTIYGKIVAMSSYLSASGTLSTKIEFDENANFIHDSYILVSFEYNQHVGIAVPEKTVMKNNTGNFVYKITENNTATQLYIDAGIRTGNNIEVLSDNLSIGDKIVLEGLTKVFEGVKVQTSQPEGDDKDTKEGSEKTPAEEFNDKDASKETSVEASQKPTTNDQVKE